MASGGSLRRSLSDSRSFDFCSDDVLCAYDDYTAQQDQTDDARRLDPSAKDLHENRDKRPLVDLYGQPEGLSREDVISAVAVENSMKKYADNLMRYLEGISGRLTQLELYCYKLEKSVSEFRTDTIHAETEADTKLKSIEKHVHEVQRSLQIVRDKQELFETQKELTKLQLSQNESTKLSELQKNGEDVKASTSEAKDASGMPNQQLALVLPQQRSSPPSHPIRATADHNQPYKELPVQQPAPASLNVPPQDGYIPNQASTYYSQHQPPPQEQLNRHLPPELHYAPQMQNLSVQAQSLPQAQVLANQLNQQQPFSQYQQHWPPSQPRQPSPQVQVPMPQTLPIHPPYAPYQPANSVHERFQASSMPVPAPYSIPQSRGYGVSGSSISHPPPQHNIQRQPLSLNCQGSFRPSPLVASGHAGINPYPPQPNIQGYNSAFPIDGSWAAHNLNFQTGKYQPTINMPASPNRGDHLYGDMIEEAVSMGYPRDEVISVIRRMGGTSQLLDFNALLDELNAHASGGPPRAWSR